MKQIFDKSAEHYDEWYKTPIGRLVDDIEKREIWKWLQPKRGQTIIDVGCGTGNYTVALAKEGIAVVGVDISRAMLERALEKVKGMPVYLIESDAEQLPLKNDIFDAAICVTALEFVTDPAAALKEMHRVVKPGGKIVAGFIAGEGPWAQAYKKRGHSSIFAHARFLTENDIKNLLPGITPQISRALYFGPEIADVKIAEKIEAAHDQDAANAGFLCACWIK